MNILKKHEVPFPVSFTPQQVMDKKEYWISMVESDSLNWIRDASNLQLKIDGVLRKVFFSLGLTSHYSTDNYTYNYLYYANQLSKAFFSYSRHDGQPVTLYIADKVIQTTGKFEKNNDATGAMNVVRGIELALILRDKEALNFYQTIPFEFTEKAQHDDIVVEMILGFFQLLLAGKAYEATVPTVIDQLNKHLEWDVYQQYVRKTDFLNDAMWRYLWGHRQEKAKFLYVPLLKIYHYILIKDQTLFEEAVYEALQSWQQYYTKKYVEQGEEFDRSFEPEGYWAIPVIAACAFANDQGIKLQHVESDYLCDWMIRGDFSGFELLVNS